jgi:hypothetical protein
VKRTEESLVAKTNYFRASIILVVLTAAALVAMLLSQKPAAGVEDGVCFPPTDCTPPETYIDYGPANNDTLNLTTAPLNLGASTTARGQRTSSSSAA